MNLYTHNDPAALYRADKAAWQEMRLHEVKKVPTRTGPCCTPSTISCHSYGLASHQVLHDLALTCPISHKKK